MQSELDEAESRNYKSHSVVQPPPQFYNSRRYMQPYYKRQFRSSRVYDMEDNNDVDDDLISGERMLGMERSSYPQNYPTQPSYQTQQNYAVPQQTCGGHLLIGCQPIVRTVPCSSYQQSYGSPVYNQAPSYNVPLPVYNVHTPSYYVPSLYHSPSSTQTSYREKAEEKTESSKDSSTAKN